MTDFPFPARQAHSLKYDRRSHYSWQTHAIVWEEAFLWCLKPAPRRVIHHTRGKEFPFEDHGMEIFWKHQWFSLGASLHPKTGRLRYYCNIHLPFETSNHALQFIDLDLDVLKEGAEAARIVDWEDFEQHQKIYNYPKELVDRIPKEAERVRKLLDDEPLLGPDNLSALFQTVLTLDHPKIQENKERLKGLFLE